MERVADPKVSVGICVVGFRSREQQSPLDSYAEGVSDDGKIMDQPDEKCITQRSDFPKLIHPAG